ncbi:MAG: GH92 family glycosyl hydrolase [Bacteroidetes bacterium]|nr:GH92 family glycosyl hydrolase [Bacteroidota bacterium]
MKKIFFAIVLSFSALILNAQKPLHYYIRPLIGTDKMGHTFPGATVPFGAVQLSPETDTIPYEQNGKYNPDVYKYCAGYQYGDKTIVGFSHTHLSGTGHSDLGDFLIMPTTGKLLLNPGTAEHPESGYRSSFSHKNEIASANYYKVLLDDYHILAELTTSKRVGFHQYTFPQTDEAHIILDLMSNIYNYPDKNVWTYISVINDSLITGYRQTSGWARTRTEYFALSFSKPFISYGDEKYDGREVYRGFWGKFDQRKNFPSLAGRKLRLYFNFKTKEGEKIKLKLALSAVSQKNALENLNKEIPNWNFDQVKKNGEREWEKELQKIEINTLNEEDKISFYTAMYHAFINPTLYTDVNGEYRGLDQNIHKANGFTNYTTFSLWDTHRALHPLFNIVQPARNADMVASMLAHYDQSVMKMLPIWSTHANETWCMSGYHSVSVIADAILKGVYKGNKAKALEACITTATHRSYEGLSAYMSNGYIPCDSNGTSVSSTLEYAYDDWCIAQLAKKLKNTGVYNTFIKRSQNWKNVFDPSIRFMRPRHADGSFRKNFDVLSTNGQGFIEGNAWNYSLYVPHNPEQLISMSGGKKDFERHLDSLFTMHLPDEFFAETEDITRDGIIGNYVHGNEPAHHAVYLYNYAATPWKTQYWVRYILNKMYKPSPDGLGGNDDCGQMSAWYILSELGFYPIAPGSDKYDLGSPGIVNATLNLDNGKKFKIIAHSQKEKNVYVQKVLLNGKQLNQTFITYKDIMNGGTLEFFMTDQPNKY